MYRIKPNRNNIVICQIIQGSGAQQSSWLHLGLVPSAQGGVDLSPSKVGVEPSQQTRCSLGHLPPGRPPGLPPVGVLPSAQRLGLPPSGQGGVLLPSYVVEMTKNKICANTIMKQGKLETSIANESILLYFRNYRLDPLSG